MRTQVVYFRLYARSFHLSSVYGISFYRIFISESFCSGQLIQTVVRLGIHDIMLDFDYFTVFCADKCSSVVAVAEFIARFAGCFFYQCFSVYRFCIHCYQGSHTVTTVNIQCLSYRAKTVSSVYVATVFFVVTQAPSQFVFFSVFPVVRPEIIQVVDVSSLCTEYFSEYSLLCHVQGVHFEPVIAAVFQNHAVLASSFRQVDKFPALFQIHSRRNFDGYVLSMLHGILGNREVVIPVGCNVYQVNVFAFAECFISFCT